MTVSELIAELRKLPATAPVYVFDGDRDAWTEARSVYLKTQPAANSFGLPQGAVAIED